MKPNKPYRKDNSIIIPLSQLTDDKFTQLSPEDKAVFWSIITTITATGHIPPPNTSKVALQTNLPQYKVRTALKNLRKMGLF